MHDAWRGPDSSHSLAPEFVRGNRIAARSRCGVRARAAAESLAHAACRVFMVFIVGPTGRLPVPRLEGD